MKLNVIIGVALFSASLASYGALGKDLRDLPANVASGEDQQIMREAIVDALEHQPDNVTTGWKNPLTGGSGIIRPMETYEKDGMHCRKLRLRNTIDDESNESMFSFCKTPEGNWKFAS
jgi:surface antigen